MGTNPYESPKEPADSTTRLTGERAAFGIHPMAIYCGVHLLVIIVGWSAILMRQRFDMDWSDPWFVVVSVAVGSFCPFAVTTFVVLLISLANSYVSWTRWAAMDFPLLFIHSLFALVPVVS